MLQYRPPHANAAKTKAKLGSDLAPLVTPKRVALKKAKPLSDSEALSKALLLEVMLERQQLGTKVVIASERMCHYDTRAALEQERDKPQLSSRCGSVDG
mgnify:CR=1 FL=1